MSSSTTTASSISSSIAENIHPGKGNSVTKVEHMRRISDGVKVAASWRTVEMVGRKRPMLDEREYQYLYNDDEGFHFMDPATSQHDPAVQQGRRGRSRRRPHRWRALLLLKTFEGIAIAIELPQRVTLEIGRARTGGEGADRVVILQAGDPQQRRQDHGPAAYRRRHPRCGHDRRRSPTSNAAKDLRTGRRIALAKSVQWTDFRVRRPPELRSRGVFDA